MLSFGFFGRAALVGAITWVGVGCGGPDAKSPQALKVVNPFPTKGTLEKLAQSRPKPIPLRTVASVPAFRVDVSDLPESALVETRLSEVASGLHFTRELRCVARELGRLRAEHDADGDERVQRFIVGACGVTSPAGVSTSYSTADVPAEMTDDQLLKEWKSKLAVPASFKGLPIGAWLTRSGKKAVLMVVGGQRDAAAAAPTVSPTDAEGRITVRGTVGPDVDHVLGLVNQGGDGVAHCEPDPNVALPQYAFNCKMADGDPWAWIQVLARPTGRLLMRSGALILARREARAVVELTQGGSAASGTPADVGAAVLEGVNRARSNAKLNAVTLAAQQASSNGRLASHFFNAEATGDAHTSDTVALGLMAGWDVQGTIRNGGFFGTLLSGAKSASSWVDYALESPMGRYTLLEPNTRQIAIGSAPIESVGGLGVVITTYSLFGFEDHGANATRVMATLAKQRAARSLPPATPLGALPSLVTEAGLVNAGKREPMAGLDLALTAESQRMGQTMRGWALVTNDLDAITFPKELLAPGPLTVRIVVTHYRPEDSAWGAYLIYFVSPAPAQQQVAKAYPAVRTARR